MRSLIIITLVIVSIAVPAIAQKQKQSKVHKVVYIRSPSGNPIPVRQLTEYEQCKLECKAKRDQLSKREHVEQLRKQLEEAETAVRNRRVEERKAADEAREYSMEHNNEGYGSGSYEEFIQHELHPNVDHVRHMDEADPILTPKKESRYDHLKRAASKLAESGSDLRKAVTGTDNERHL